MTVDGKVLIGEGPDSLEGTRVDTPAGTALFREGVVVSDPDVAGARAGVTNAAPATDAYGMVVRVVGNVVLGSEVQVNNLLVPSAFDSIALSYNAAGDVSQAVYSKGGTTVATINLSYADGRVVGISRV